MKIKREIIQIWNNLHCGMGKKPLVPYTPDSARNLLPLNGIVSGAAANRSYLDLGNGILLIGNNGILLIEILICILELFLFLIVVFVLIWLLLLIKD